MVMSYGYVTSNKTNFLFIPDPIVRPINSSPPHGAGQARLLPDG